MPSCESAPIESIEERLNPALFPNRSGWKTGGAKKKSPTFASSNRNMSRDILPTLKDCRRVFTDRKWTDYVSEYGGSVASKPCRLPQVNSAGVAACMLVLSIASRHCKRSVVDFDVPNRACLSKRLSCTLTSTVICAHQVPLGAKVLDREPRHCGVRQNSCSVQARARCLKRP